MARLSSFKSKLTKIQMVFDKEVNELADLVREEVSKICIKHNLDYLAGNGSMVFYGAWGGDVVSIGNSRDAATDYDGQFSYLVKIFEVLELEVGRDDYLGFYVADVKTMQRFALAARRGLERARAASEKEGS